MKIKIEVCGAELLALHSCIKIILQKEIPPNQSDVGLLMEAMSKIAIQYDNRKDKEKDFILNLEEKQVIPLWHCCNIVIKNNLQKDHQHMTDILKVMGKLAIEADKVLTASMSPKVLVP